MEIALVKSGQQVLWLRGTAGDPFEEMEDRSCTPTKAPARGQGECSCTVLAGYCEFSRFELRENGVQPFSDMRNAAGDCLGQTRSQPQGNVQNFQAYQTLIFWPRVQLPDIDKGHMVGVCVLVPVSPRASRVLAS
ncbi:unnamed protein product [Pleuronectes platessa]|uniref:Uncharacterized protein n=1 Tax=Pleuronectes platessa TaxID=8262 RepID=A0A9N7VFA1_PLEPL|nr:unnamed protein product [Pleuronectes platessa]